MIGEALWNLPIWVIVILVTAILMAGHELGVQVRRRTSGRISKDLDAEGIGGSYMTASLSLLALLVAFSFSMAVERYNNRRTLVLEEANAITSLYRRLEAVDPQKSPVLHADLVAYLAAREQFSRTSAEGDLQAAEAQTEAVQQRLWSDLLASVGHADLSAHSLMESADHMFSIASTRRASLEAVVPATVLFAMLSYAVIAAMVMGYSHRADRRYVVASSVQFALLAIALGLIVDLDRPRSGLVKVSQAPMIRAGEAIRKAEAARTPAPVSPAPSP